VAERVFGRIKFLARLKTYQESLPQDGRISTRRTQKQKRHPRRHLPDRHRRKNCPPAVQFRNGKALGRIEFPAAANAELEKFLRQTTGLLLLTGPAGSGKTTTIYACLRHLAELGGRHIITVEDPVEQIVPGTMQTEINEAVGLDFAAPRGICCGRTRRCSSSAKSATKPPRSSPSAPG
jgi:general secretion pathway protein E